MTTDIKVNVMFHDKKFNKKPQAYETATIQKEIKQTTISLRELAEKMSQGCTFKPAYLNGTKSNDFVSQQLFGIDFDHGTTIDKTLNRCRALGIMPVFGYTTFSHTPEEHRFRLVFLNNEVIYDIEKRKKLQRALMIAMGFADPKCKDETRLFYGGKSLIMFNADNIIDGDKIIEQYYVEAHSEKTTVKNKVAKSQKATEKTSVKKTILNRSKEIEEKVKAISELNVSEMKRLLKVYSVTSSNAINVSSAASQIKSDISKMTSLNKKVSGLDISHITNSQNKLIKPTFPKINKPTVKINAKLDIEESKHQIKADLSHKKKIINNDNEKIDINDCDYQLSNMEILIIMLLISSIIKVVHQYGKPKGVLGGTNNKDNLILSVPTKTPSCSPNIEMSQSNTEKQIFKCRKDLYNYINTEIDLSEYLGIGGDTVCCILPNHDDSSPSAHIYTNENGVQFYKCFGCDTARNIIGITEHLSGCKRSEAIEFIKAVYDLELVESEWTQQQKQLMLDCANYLDSDEFQIEFPDLYKSIRTRKHHIKLMLLHFSEMVNEDMQIDGKPFFFASYPKLMEICDIKKRAKLSQSLTLFALLHMIEKLPEDKIPEKELTKAKSIAAKYGLKKITNFYAFEEYGVNSFTESEKKALYLKENNVSLKGLSRELVLTSFGIDEANRVYPQYKFENERGTSEKSDIHTAHIVECIMHCIENKGYATERDIVAMLGSQYNFLTTEVQIKKRLQEILVTYELERVRANKETKAQYNVVSDGYPFIIVRK